MRLSSRRESRTRALRGRFQGFVDATPGAGPGARAVGDGHLPVGVVGVEGLHRLDDLLAERRLDQGALPGPDPKENPEEIPVPAGTRFRFALSLLFW